ncbi:predicted protein [Nematostella vectensis]|uniref:Telomere length and silencing protein 1 homolog n=1 Tax=Nematostella vectensis TaxID=45351 RepID=A7RMW7_NEMVE|nr:predicted protein [Nematostella vectensis]|eukprot:XP_001639280.1 predicted protein [Nematostella vectensis]
MSKRNYRRKRITEDEDDEAEVAIEALEERREIQKFRKRPKGVSAVGLALGKKVDIEDEVESDPFKLKTGGLVQINDLIQDRERDREGEDSGKSINLGENFAAETNRREEDTHMLKYIEEEISKRKGQAESGEDINKVRDKFKTKEDLLFQVPKHIDVRSRLMKSEEMLSNQMLSGIPEVDLGISAKIRNIEATEEAKMKVIEEQRSKRKHGPTEMVPTNMASNFMLHSRFMDEQKNAEAERRKTATLRATKDDGKAKPQPVVEKATDDFYYEKFRKRARDSWRYQ